MKEIKRLKVMSMLEEKLMTRSEAAEMPNISKRQVYRTQKSYREKGEQGLVHGPNPITNQQLLQAGDSWRSLRVKSWVLSMRPLNK